MCELQHLTWWYDIPEKEKVAEIGVFARNPRPVASEAVELPNENAVELAAVSIGHELIEFGP